MKRTQSITSFFNKSLDLKSLFVTGLVLTQALSAVAPSWAAPAQKADKPASVANAFGDAENYMREIFGSPVPSKVTAAELAAGLELGLPLPGEFVDNGPAPLPMAMPKQMTAKNHTHSNEMMASLPAYMNSRALLWPMRGGYVSSRFGYRWGRQHRGTDIAAPVGTPIFAAAAGRVVFSGWEDGYGKLVVVDHGNGTHTKYGHCSVLLVNVGTIVKQGAVLGKVGLTGRTTGPHLHYEVVRNGVTLNPEFATRRF